MSHFKYSWKKEGKMFGNSSARLFEYMLNQLFFLLPKKKAKDIHVWISTGEETASQPPTSTHIDRFEKREVR